MTALAVTREYTDNGKGSTDLVGLLVAASLSMEFPNAGDLIMIINNGSGGSITATLVGQPDPYGRGGATVGDEAQVIPTLKIGFIPFMHPAMFNSSGKATVTLSAVTTVTVGLFRLSRRR